MEYKLLGQLQAYKQWGYKAGSGSITVFSITFPIAFGTIYNAVCSSIGATTGNSKNSGMTANLTTTKMDITVDSSGGYWIAVGKS